LRCNILSGRINQFGTIPFPTSAGSVIQISNDKYVYLSREGISMFYPTTETAQKINSNESIYPFSGALRYPPNSNTAILFDGFGGIRIRSLYLDTFTFKSVGKLPHGIRFVCSFGWRSCISLWKPLGS